MIKVYDGIQMPVYYVSKTLLDVETRHLPLEKVTLALIYSVYVLTELPLQALLRRSNFIGIAVKWGATLGAFDIRYKSWNSVKGQVLENFVAEFSPESMVVCGVQQISTRQWRIYVDGA